jgi:hypothetical protein
LGPADDTVSPLSTPDRFAWTAAVAATVVAAVLCVVSYERHPHLPDEVVYQHHARYFAEGHLTLAAPPVPAAFNVDLFEYEPTRWYSPVPPGWPAVLAIVFAWPGGVIRMAVIEAKDEIAHRGCVRFGVAKQPRRDRKTVVLLAGFEIVGNGDQAVDDAPGFDVVAKENPTALVRIGFNAFRFDLRVLRGRENDRDGLHGQFSASSRHRSRDDGKQAYRHKQKSADRETRDHHSADPFAASLVGDDLVHRQHLGYRDARFDAADDSACVLNQ